MSERSEFDITSQATTVTDVDNLVIIPSSNTHKLLKFIKDYKWYILVVFVVCALIFLAVYLGVNKSEVSSTPTIKSTSNTFRNRHR